MSDKKVWFITGAGRGMGVDIARAALAAGCAVVATGRNPHAVAVAVGEADDLLVVELDVTDARHARPLPGRPSIASAGSTSSSTTPVTSTPAISRRSPPSRWSVN
jgi:NAD(P)-dependent dehydrogenase (short-subunit alcohol dehydrogenase family)